MPGPMLDRLLAAALLAATLAACTPPPPPSPETQELQRRFQMGCRPQGNSGTWESEPYCDSQM